MRINLRGAWTGLPILLAMGLSGGGVALWRDLRPPQAAVSHDAALQTQWRRIMALRIPDGERAGERIDKQPFSPIAIPLAGAKLIAWHPQGKKAPSALASGTMAVTRRRSRPASSRRTLISSRCAAVTCQPSSREVGA